MRFNLRNGLMISMSLVLLAIIGCNQDADPYPRLGYSGAVTLDGQPMSNGFLYLEPLERQPTQSYTTIQDGQFKVEPSAGAVPGRYRVSIVRDDSTELPPGVDPQTPEGAAIADKLSRTAPSKPVHPLYNVNSKLVAELRVDAINEFEFHLQSNPDPASFK